MTAPAYEFSTDPRRVDPAWVSRMLADHAYWAVGRTRQTQDAAIAGSRNYGVYDSMTGQQLAYARVVTDGATFAWVCDVIVDPERRGGGIGVTLMAGVAADLEPLGLRRIVLATGDAHGLYEKFGFTALKDPTMWMERPGRLAD